MKKHNKLIDFYNNICLKSRALFFVKASHIFLLFFFILFFSFFVPFFTQKQHLVEPKKVFLAKKNYFSYISLSSGLIKKCMKSSKAKKFFEAWKKDPVTREKIKLMKMHSINIPSIKNRAYQPLVFVYKINLIQRRDQLTKITLRNTFCRLVFAKESNYNDFKRNIDYHFEMDRKIQLYKLLQKDSETSQVIQGLVVDFLNINGEKYSIRELILNIKNNISNPLYQTHSSTRHRLMTELSHLLSLNLHLDFITYQKAVNNAKISEERAYKKTALFLFNTLKKEPIILQKLQTLDVSSLKINGKGYGITYLKKITTQTKFNEIKPSTRRELFILAKFTKTLTFKDLKASIINAKILQNAKILFNTLKEDSETLKKLQNLHTHRILFNINDKIYKLENLKNIYSVKFSDLYQLMITLTKDNIKISELKKAINEKYHDRFKPFVKYLFDALKKTPFILKKLQSLNDSRLIVNQKHYDITHLKKITSQTKFEEITLHMYAQLFALAEDRVFFDIFKIAIEDAKVLSGAKTLFNALKKESDILKKLQNLNIHSVLLNIKNKHYRIKNLKSINSVRFFDVYKLMTALTRDNIKISELKKAINEFYNWYKASQIEKEDNPNKYPKQYTKIAFHEAGHALILLYFQQKTSALKFWVKQMTIQTKNKQILGNTLYETIIDQKFKKQLQYQELFANMAGFVAEKIFFGSEKQEWGLKNVQKQHADEKRYINIKKKLDNLDWKFWEINKDNVEKKIIKIMTNPYNLKVISLLAEALLVMRKLERADIEYIYQNAKMPLNIIKKQKNVQKKINKNIFTPRMQAKLSKLEKMLKINWQKVAAHEAAHILFTINSKNKLKSSFFWTWEKSGLVENKYFDLQNKIAVNLKYSTKKNNAHSKTYYKINTQKLNNECKNLKIWNQYMLTNLAGHVAENVFFGENEKWKWEDTHSYAVYPGLDSMIFLKKWTIFEKIYTKCNVDKKINILDFKNQIKLIIEKPRNIKVLVLLAKALIIKEKLTKKEIMYIYETNKLPLTIKEKKVITWSLQPNIHLLLEKANKLENWFQIVKKNLLDLMYLLKKEKLTINNKDYYFSHLIHERSKKSIVTLSNEAIQELRTLIKNSIQEKNINNFLFSLKKQGVWKYWQNNKPQQTHLKKYNITNIKGVNIKDLFQVESITEYDALNIKQKTILQNLAQLPNYQISIKKAIVKAKAQMVWKYWQNNKPQQTHLKKYNITNIKGVNIKDLFQVESITEYDALNIKQKTILQNLAQLPNYQISIKKTIANVEKKRQQILIKTFLKPDGILDQLKNTKQTELKIDEKTYSLKALLKINWKTKNLNIADLSLKAKKELLELYAVVNFKDKIQKLLKTIKVSSSESKQTKNIMFSTSDRFIVIIYSSLGFILLVFGIFSFVFFRHKRIKK